MQIKTWHLGLVCALNLVMAAGSGDDDDEMPSDENALGAPNPAGERGDTQTPPTTNERTSKRGRRANTRRGPARRSSTRSSRCRHTATTEFAPMSWRQASTATPPTHAPRAQQP